MENYDDVRQFINKVGDQNLNYRSFPADAQSSGQSKWHLLNQVASYKPQVSERQSERVVVLNKGIQKPEFAVTPDTLAFADTLTKVPAQTELSHLSTAFPQAQPKNSFAKGFSHLFKDPQPQEPQAKSVVNDSLSALLSRIGS